MKKLRLGEILIAEGKVDDAQVKSALAHQRRWGKKLGDCLVDLGFISEIDLIQALSRFLRLPIIDVTRIEAAKITPEILNCVPVQIARKHRLVPLALKEIKRKQRLVVGTSDPTAYAVFDEIQFKAGYPLLIMLAPDSDIDWFIRKFYMNEGEALPYNYVSGISIIQEKEQDKGDEDSFEGLKTDPIASIFFDEDFTGASQLYRSGGPKDDKKKK